MKDKFLKMAGVKSEQEFYKMFPTEEAFFKAYPKARKMQTGGGLQDQEIFQYPNYDGNMVAYYQKMNEDRANNPMGAIGDFVANASMAAGQAADNAQGNGEDMGNKMQMAKLAMNVMGMPAMQMGGVGTMMRDNYYDEGGEMALGQVMAMHDKLSRLQKFINGETEIDPWVASKITLADDYLNTVADYMQFNEGAEGEEEEEEDSDLTMGELEEMKNGGIPQRYRSRGFTKVGVKRQSNRPGKKWMVLAKKGDKYKIVHGGYKGMKDFSQHGSEKRKKNFWNRMGGKDSSKATDPFSPLYWHKRFGTWAEGGEPNNAGFQALPDYVQAKILSNMGYGGNIYQMGGQDYSDPRFEQYYNQQIQQLNQSGVQKRDMPSRDQMYQYFVNTNPPTYTDQTGRMLFNTSNPKMPTGKTFTESVDPKTGRPISKPVFNEPYKKSFQDGGSTLTEEQKAAAAAAAAKKKKRNETMATVGAALGSIGFMVGNEIRNKQEQGGLEIYKNSNDPRLGTSNQPSNKELRQLYRNRKMYGGDSDMYGGEMDMDAMYQMMKGGNIYQDGGQEQNPVMQAIQMYAQMTEMDPQQLMQQLQALPPLEQQEAIQKIMQAIQEAQSSQMAYGGIHINPANKGKFTASANRAGMGVQEFARHVLANKEDYSSTQVKRANFARNAAKWKKQMGGMTEGAELELHPDEIQNLIDQGYGIEYLD